MAKSRVELEIENRDKGRLRQAFWSRHWHSCARFCCPEKAESTLNLAYSANPDYRPDPQRHNDVAVDGLRVLSGGVKSWVCPGPSTGWWSWEPNPKLSGISKVKDWLADCVQRADMAMDAGGYYTAAHLNFQDLGVIGTAGMFIDSTGDLPLTCKALSATEFTFSLTFDGQVSDVQVTYHRSAQQLVDKFGKAAVPDTVRADVEGNKGEKMHEVIHAVFTRRDDEMGSREEYSVPGDPKLMKYGSMWIHVGRKVAMLESGYEEMPFVIPRWRIQTGTDGLYGIPPAMDALASARGVNLMDMLAATQVELAVNPRIKAPPGTGAIDLSPGGITQISTSETAPTEWLSDSTRAGLAGAENFIARKEAQILRAFHADLFERLAPIAQKRELTNGLVDALERESLSRIAPAMGQISQDYIGPGLLRIFMVCYRAGIFAPPPDEAFHTDTVGRRYLVFPRVAQTSRMAQALNSRKLWAFRSFSDRVLPIANLRPEILDNYNFDNIMRDLDRGDGMPGDWHVPEDEVESIRQARQLAQQQAQQASMVMELATKQPGLVESAANAIGGQAS